jgi:anti-anti-sigma factor
VSFARSQAARGARATHAEVAYPLDRVAVIALEGEHDMAHVGEVAEALRRASERCRTLLVDLSRCTFISSATLSELWRGQEAVAPDGRFALVLPPGESAVQRIAEAMRLAELFATYDTLEDAFANAVHDTRVRDLRARFGEPDRFRAECSCGWRGEERTGLMALRGAKNDARDHGHTRPSRTRSGARR